MVSPSKGSALITPSPKYTSNKPWSFSWTYHTLLSLSTELISVDCDQEEVEPPVDATVTVILVVSTLSSDNENLWFTIKINNAENVKKFIRKKL